MSFVMWSEYTSQMKDAIQNMYFAKHFTKKLAKTKNLFLSQSDVGDEVTDFARLYILVDPEDGVICDAAYQALGGSVLIMLLETLCALLIRKNYMQAKRISKELIAKELGVTDAFSLAITSEMDLVLKLVEQTMQKCVHISVRDIPNTPTPNMTNSSGYVDQFFTMPIKTRIQHIERVIEEDIRPYIELDLGGIEVMDLKGNVVIIQYRGECTSCPSAIGGTVSYIQESLQSRVHPDLVVEPDLSNFELHTNSQN